MQISMKVFLVILLISMSKASEDHDYSSFYDEAEEEDLNFNDYKVNEVLELKETLVESPGEYSDLDVNEVEDIGDEGANDYLDEKDDNVDNQESFGLSRALNLLPRETAMKLAPTLNVSKESADAVARFANAHPYAIVNFTLGQLDHVLKRSKVIYMLNNDTINYLIRSEGIMMKLSKLPKTTLAAMISSNPYIMTNFPMDEEVAAMNLTKELLKDKLFLARIPLKVHAYLAESSFRHHLTHQDVSRIIAVHPTIPDHLGSHGKALIPELIHVPLFLRNLPCKAITTVALNKDIMESLGTEELGVLVRNERIWQCLPVDVIRRVVKDVRIGGKVGMGDLWAAATTMGKEKSLDSEVIRNVFQYQFTDFASRNFAFGFYPGK